VQKRGRERGWFWYGVCGLLVVVGGTVLVGWLLRRDPAPRELRYGELVQVLNASKEGGRVSVRNVRVTHAEVRGEIVLAEEFRPPLKAPVVSLPAGLVGDEGPEDASDAARRELAEETGYEAREMVQLAEGPVAVGVEDQPRHLAVPYVNKSCDVRSHVFQLQPAQLAVPAVVAEHDDPLAAELTVLVRLGGAIPHASKNSRHASAIAATPNGHVGESGSLLELDLWVGPLGSAEVPAFPVRVDRSVGRASSGCARGCTGPLV